MTEPRKDDQPKGPTSLMALSHEAARVEAMIMELAIANGGEVNPDLDAYLDEIKTRIAEKPDQYKYVIDRLEASSEMLYAQVRDFQRAAIAMESTVKAMKDRIKAAMEMMGVTEVKGKAWRFSISPIAKRLVVSNDDVFVKEHPEFSIVKTTVSVDTKRLKAALEAGHEIPGARLEGGYRLNKPSVLKGGE